LREPDDIPDPPTTIMTPSEFRQSVRSGAFRQPTAGQCGPFAQANLAILPNAYAHDFLRFCQANPKA